MSSLEVRNDATDAAEATGPTPTLAAGFASLAAFVEKSHACAHPQARCRLWLRHLCERFAAPLAVLRWTAGDVDVHERWRSPDGSAVTWLPVLEALGMECEVERRPVLMELHEEVGETIVGVAVPLFGSDGTPTGYCSFVVHLLDGMPEALILGQVSSAVVWVNLALAGLKPPPPGASGLAATSAPTVADLGDRLVSDLRSRTGAVIVAFGMVRRGRARLVAVSGLDEPDARAAGTASLCQAMEECADRGTPVFGGAGALPDGVESGRLHDQWAELAGLSGALSIPVPHGRGRTAIVTLVRGADRPFAETEIEELARTLAHVGPALEVLQRAERGFRQLAVDRVTGVLGRLGDPAAWRRSLWILVSGVGLAWFLFGSIDDSVVVPCTAEAGAVRHVGAPYEARLVEALVRDGDVVRAGDLLCRFDASELELQHAELRAELETLEVEQRQQLAEGAVTDASVTEARKAVVEARLRALERRIEDAEVRAHVDGRVIRGDLTERLGEVLPQGEPLFEIAAADEGLRLDVAVPERRALDVALGSPVRFVGDARPDATVELALTRAATAAEVVDGRNVVRAEARFVGDEPPTWLRPGMRGLAEISLGRRRVYAVVLQHIEDGLRSLFGP